MQNPSTTAENNAAATTADMMAPAALPSRWTARIGLAIVAGLLVSCFGILIAASTGGI